MGLTTEDRLAIGELISLHGRLVDAGEFDRFVDLFTPDVVQDVSGFGGGSLVGIEAIRDAAVAMGSQNPLGHHVTNIVISEEPEGNVTARSKGIGVKADGACGTVTYEDSIVWTPSGWRISSRTVRARRTPLAA